MSYPSRRRWADKFIPEISRLLAEVFVCPAPDYKDMHEATDLMILTVKPFDVACRMRKHYAWENKYWRNQFTIRAGVVSGAKTEYDKIVDGFGHYMFYGFATEDDTVIQEARILNLNVFRATLIRGEVPWEPVNNDDRSHGRAYNVADFPTDLVFKHWTPDALQPVAPAQHEVIKLEHENEELRARLEYLETAAPWAV